MTVFQIKAIKPGRLKVDAIRLELLNALRKEGREAEKDLKKCVQTWNNPPDFTSEIQLSGTEAALITGATGNGEAVQHFNWVNEGTSGHYVPKSGSATMTFNTKYKAKTRPGHLGSGSGGPGGERITRRGRWYVRGIAARKFTDTVQRTRKQRFHRAMIAAIQSGAQKVWAK